MNHLTLQIDNSNPDLHKCHVKKEGDWLIFTCSKCPGYERRINMVTRQMKLHDPFQGKYSHSGSYSPQLFKTLN